MTNAQISRLLPKLQALCAALAAFNAGLSVGKANTFNAAFHGALCVFWFCCFLGSSK